eukprot:3743941-Prymnesium_polylepis.1
MGEAQPVGQVQQDKRGCGRAKSAEVRQERGWSRGGARAARERAAIPHADEADDISGDDLRRALDGLNGGDGREVVAQRADDRFALR